MLKRIRKIGNVFFCTFFAFLSPFILIATLSIGWMYGVFLQSHYQWTKDSRDLNYKLHQELESASNVFDYYKIFESSRERRTIREIRGPNQKCDFQSSLQRFCFFGLTYASVMTLRDQGGFLINHLIPALVSLNPKDAALEAAKNDNYRVLIFPKYSQCGWDDICTEKIIPSLACSDGVQGFRVEWGYPGDFGEKMHLYKDNANIAFIDALKAFARPYNTTLAQHSEFDGKDVCRVRH